MNYVLWMDSEKADIFSLTATGVEKAHVKKSGIDHHSHNKKDQSTDANLEHFFKELASKLQGAEQILILGPGLAKNHFRSHLESHPSDGLGKKIVGLENSDHPTDNQILASARKFFTQYELFNTPVKPSA